MESRANDHTGNSQNLKVLSGIKRSFTIKLVVRLEVKIIFITFIISFILFTDGICLFNPSSQCLLSNRLRILRF